MSSTQYWQATAHSVLCKLAEQAKSTHLEHLLTDEKRNERFMVEADNIVLDFSREKMTEETLQNLLELANARGLQQSIAKMFSGEFINETERRPVLHVALRAAEVDEFKVNGVSIVPDVVNVLQQIRDFSDRVRSGKFKGYTGKTLSDVICIGIGGSYLGPEFVYEAMRTYGPCQQSAHGRQLRFLANVDPIDIERATEGLNPETTLVIVISKTFTTAETMLNARTLKTWLLKSLKDEEAIGCHMAAVSTNLKATSEFGIKSENVFGFWDWVGGRFSVTSAVGCLPLALHFGFDHVQAFLDGCRSMDLHFKNAPFEKNLPVLMGLISIWNSTYLGYGDVAVLPYCQALLRFPAHIQQLTMESNGKRVTIDGVPLPSQAGEVYFGEPGTNGQHSFYQLLHQGRVVPSEFIGFCKSQSSLNLPDEPVSNHDELMSNFFAQPDALALGKSAERCRKEGIPEELIQHKVFVGDRPSLSLLLPICDPYNVGVLLSLYEHRTAVQGFIWNVNSFDQWGVELGKVLAKNVRNIFNARRNNKSATDLESELPSSCRSLMKKYLAA